MVSQTIPSGADRKLTPYEVQPDGVSAARGSLSRIDNAFLEPCLMNAKAV
jgi:hypothetical protein